MRGLLCARETDSIKNSSCAVCLLLAQSRRRQEEAPKIRQTPRHPLITTHINPSIQLKTELPQRRSLKSNDPNVTVIALFSAPSGILFPHAAVGRRDCWLLRNSWCGFMGFHWVERFHYSTHKLPARLRLLFLTGAQFRPDVNRPVSHFYIFVYWF